MRGEPNRQETVLILWTPEFRYFRGGVFAAIRSAECERGVTRERSRANFARRCRPFLAGQNA